MAQNQLNRIAKRFFARNKALDAKTAQVIASLVLADGLVSRAEKRFLQGLLKRQKLNKSAELALHGMLAAGSPGSL